MSKKRKNKKNHSVLVYFLLIIGLILIYSHYIEPYNLEIKEYKIENKKIPQSFDGLKIIHLSDIHYGSTVDLNYLKKIVELTNKQKPDIIVITGDLLDIRVKPTKKEIDNINKLLTDIDSSLGKYIILGNHDIKHKKEFSKIIDNNFELLSNEEKILYYKSNTPISIIGLNNYKTNYEIVKNNTDYYRIVLTHEPDVFNKIKNYQFDLLLAGHSHNGQIRIPLIGTIYTPKGAKNYFDNYYNIDNKEIFVSNGIGTSTIDFRFNSKPSINFYRLYAQQ